MIVEIDKVSELLNGFWIEDIVVVVIVLVDVDIIFDLDDILLDLNDMDIDVGESYFGLKGDLDGFVEEYVGL